MVCAPRTATDNHGHVHCSEPRFPSLARAVLAVGVADIAAAGLIVARENLRVLLLDALAQGMDVRVVVDAVLRQRGGTAALLLLRDQVLKQ